MQCQKADTYTNRKSRKTYNHFFFGKNIGWFSLVPFFYKQKQPKPPSGNPDEEKNYNYPSWYMLKIFYHIYLPHNVAAHGRAGFGAESSPDKIDTHYKVAFTSYSSGDK